MKNKILPYILLNAYEHEGSVNAKAVLGLVLRVHPELKADVPVVLKEIEALAKGLGKKSKNELKEQLQKLQPELLRTKPPEAVQGPLKPLPHALQGKVVVRIAPSPSGALHIGHTYGASLNYEYAKMYGGKFILRIEDTNPENIYPAAYELIEQDTRWLTENAVETVVVQSQRLGTYYDYAERLVAQGNAYVCTCNPDQWRELKQKCVACPCHSLLLKEQQVRYAKMFNEYAEGEAVLRMKTDLTHKNPAMRDFPIMRVNEHIHPKTGKEQRVWPLMVFSVAVDDHELGITHVINGKDHADNALKEQMIMEKLGWKPLEYKHWGMINFAGMPLSASKTRLAIGQNEYHGWDDIRLPFLPALRRRGYQPEAFRKFALEIGLSLNDKTVAKEEFWKMVNAFNKDIIEPKANRYFVIVEPVQVALAQAPAKKVTLALHPDFPERGTRSMSFTGKCFIARKDYDELREGKLHRLMDCCNFVMETKNKKKTLRFASENYDYYKNAKNKGKIIHWLPTEGNIDVEIMGEDGKMVAAVGETTLRRVSENDLVQFERMFFARIDGKTKDKIKAWYLHT